MNSATPASSSSRAGADHPGGVAAGVAGQDAPPAGRRRRPAALAASIAISSARSELMLLAASWPEYDSSSPIGIGSAAGSARRRPSGAAQQPGQRQRRRPAAARACHVTGAARWRALAVALHVRPAPARRSCSPADRGEEVADHGARRRSRWPRPGCSPTHWPVLEQRLHLGQRRGCRRPRPAVPFAFSAGSAPVIADHLRIASGDSASDSGDVPGHLLVLAGPGHREGPARVLHELVLGRPPWAAAGRSRSASCCPGAAGRRRWARPRCRRSPSRSAAWPESLQP